MTDDEGGERRKRPEFPLLFEPAKPSLSERMLSPLRELFRSPSGDDEAAGEPGARPGDAPGEQGGAGTDEDGPDRTGRPSGPPAGVHPAPREQSPVGARAEDDEEAPGPVQRATIQLLPGRLQPQNPEVVRQEVRFLRSGVRESAVTLGWEVGEPPGHVTLDHPSILPRHARMRFRDGEWTIESLSDEDPVEVNGEPLPPDDWPRSLRSGDLVRIGEAVFRFHQP